MRESRTRLYRIFENMKSRCNNPNNSHYSSYGAKGIKVEWDSYKEFKKDMYESYLKHCKENGENNTSIDRIDVNSNYCKDNCKWATRVEQDHNRRNTIYIELLHEELVPLNLFAKEHKLSADMLRKRYRRSKYNGTNKIPYNELIRDNDIV